MPRTDDDVALDTALDPLVLAPDIGSTATRGGVHDASGRRVRGAPRATGSTYEPRPAYVEHHAGRRARFAEVYDALVRD